MKYSLALLSVSSLGLAFPAVQNDLEARQRQGLVDTIGDGVGGLLTNLAENVESLLGSVAESVNPDNLRPEPGYVFMEPGPNDSRGMFWSSRKCVQRISNLSIRPLPWLEPHGQLRLPTT